MTNIANLPLHERLEFEAVKLEQLYADMRSDVADLVVSRALEDLARRLQLVQRCFQDGDDKGLRKGLRGIVAVSDQIGLTLIVQVSKDVILTLDEADHVALTATIARLLRTGEQYLVKVWQIRGLSN